MSSENPKLHEIQPREVVGRDTIAKYQAQFRAAALKCLSLLDDSINRVYCDFQDDFVTRIDNKGVYRYNFYQVKTKSKLNHQWSVLEIFGIYKRRRDAYPEKIADSFAGRLYLHSINFNKSCGDLIFLTNIHLDDTVESFITALKNADKENKHFKILFENFNNVFLAERPLDDERVLELLRKLKIEPNKSYLSPNDYGFPAIARETIFNFSEIDLRHKECEQIIINLISLVEKKSFTKLLKEISESELDNKAGIGIEDMLDILSISKGAYKLLKQSGDSRAIKNASIIHRLLSEANASEQMIEFASSCKVNWDFWLRSKRHSLAEFELNFLLESVKRTAHDWVREKEGFDLLEIKIESLFNKYKSISNTLTKELLLGAAFAAMVRNESQ